MNYVGNKYLGDGDRAARTYQSAKMTPNGLNQNNFIFLASVGRNPGISQAEIGRLTLFDRAVIARSVARLEELGYVRREYYPGDNKTVHLFLTDRGEGVFGELNRYVNRWNEAVYRAAGYAPEQAEEMLRRLGEAARAVLETELDGQEQPDI